MDEQVRCYMRSRTSPGVQKCGGAWQDVVVLDTGSGFLKAISKRKPCKAPSKLRVKLRVKVGFSGEDAPRAVLPTAMATAMARSLSAYGFQKPAAGLPLPGR